MKLELPEKPTLKLDQMVQICKKQFVFCINEYEDLGPLVGIFLVALQCFILFLKFFLSSLRRFNWDFKILPEEETLV